MKTVKRKRHLEMSAEYHVSIASEYLSMNSSSVGQKLQQLGHAVRNLDFAESFICELEKIDV